MLEVKDQVSDGATNVTMSLCGRIYHNHHYHVCNARLCLHAFFAGVGSYFLPSPPPCYSSPALRMRYIISGTEASDKIGETQP